MENQPKTAGKTACYAKFKFENCMEEKTILCLLPGIARVVSTLERLGFKADCIADQSDLVKVTGYDEWEWLDFLKVVRAVRLDLKRIIIQNTTQDQAIFDEGLLVGRTINAYESNVRRIDLQPFVDVRAFDRTKITIVWDDDPLPLDAITYMALTLPPKAHIIITFVFDV